MHFYKFEYKFSNTMDDLKSLINLLSKQKVKQIEIITEEVELSEKTKQLYEGIKNSEFHSDEEAALSLYGTTPKNETYRKLKYRLKERLINTLFFIDIQNYSRSKFEKALNRSYKNWAAYSILKQKGLRSVSINIIENTLKTSVKYDITNLNMLIIKELKLHYSIFDYNNYKEQKYIGLYDHYKNIYNLEEQSELLYSKTMKYVVSTKSYEYNLEVKRVEDEIYVLMDKSKDIDSYFLHFYLFNAAYIINLVKKEC